MNNTPPPVYYAIGDIHGEGERLIELHKKITDFHRHYHKGKPHIRIHLGDYIDRGPDSFSVIRYVRNMERTSPFPVISLMGNHESLMLAACAGGRRGAMQTWLNNGGEATLESYRANGFTYPPEHHLDWMRKLPTRFYDKENGLIFVHAGIDPETFPEDQDDVRLWTRQEDFFDSPGWKNPSLDHIRVIHGHTPILAGRPETSKDGRRINIDTGACYGGVLSAVSLASGEAPHFLTV